MIIILGLLGVFVIVGAAAAAVAFAAMWIGVVIIFFIGAIAGEFAFGSRAAGMITGPLAVIVVVAIGTVVETMRAKEAARLAEVERQQIASERQRIEEEKRQRKAELSASRWWWPFS